MGKLKAAGNEVFIEVPRFNEITFNVIGESPLIFHTMSEKAKQTILLPPQRKGATERAATLKHDPVQEFRDSALQLPSGPTLLVVPSTMFKKSMSTAALHAQGATKAAIGRLVYVLGEHVHIAGIPQLHMAVVRNSDINKTPDVRTRCIMSEWATSFTVRHFEMVSAQSIAALLTLAGQVCGIGDWRVEKGAGTYGRFRIVSADDADFLRIVKSGGRAEQVSAMENPSAYNGETRTLLEWFEIETKRRGMRAVA